MYARPREHSRLILTEARPARRSTKSRPQSIALRPFVYNVCSPVNLVAFVAPENCKCADYFQIFNIPGL